jgi:hypothetical protein
VSYLAKPARSFVLTIRVPVRRHLEQKEQRDHCQSERQPSAEPAPLWFHNRLHFLYPENLNVSRVCSLKMAQNRAPAILT